MRWPTKWTDTYSELDTAADPANYNPILTMPATKVLEITEKLLIGIQKDCPNIAAPEVTPDCDGGLWIEWINGKRPYILIT